jgi:hypothetical protein
MKGDLGRIVVRLKKEPCKDIIVDGGPFARPGVYPTGAVRGVDAFPELLKTWPVFSSNSSRKSHANGKHVSFIFTRHPRTETKRNMARKPRSQSPKLNPALRLLQVLVGDWDMELSGASFLPDLKAKVHGPVSFEWIENGAFLVMHQGQKKVPQATWLVGRDESTDLFKVLYFDARGISRIYEMSFGAGEWRMWRNAPGFWQRFRGILAKNHNTITAEWEKSDDGQKWEHDFYIKYTRA